MRAAIVVADSVTALDARHVDAVLVSGSHGGLIAARYTMAARVRAAVFNDAGIGLDDAGIAGLAALQSIGMAGVAVSHLSARIGDGGDTLASGVVSRANGLASGCGVTAGMPCRAAAELLRDAPTYATPSALSFASEGRHVLRAASGASPAVLAIDSIGLVLPRTHTAFSSSARTEAFMEATRERPWASTPTRRSSMMPAAARTTPV